MSLILLLTLTIVGAATCLLLPADWQSGVLAGWLAAFALEFILDWRRRVFVRTEHKSPNTMLGITVAGFLGKLVLLGVGGVASAYLHLFHTASYLLAFVSAALIGEAVSLTALMRATRVK